MNSEALRALARRGAVLRLAELEAETQSLRAAIRELEDHQEPLPIATTSDHEPTTPKTGKGTGRRTWTAKQKAAQSRRARKYWRAQRKEK